MNELISPIVNFVLLIGVLFYLLRKPLREMLASRKIQIRDQIEAARLEKLNAEHRYREFNDKLSAFEIEAKNILDRAAQDGEALKAKIIREAQATASQIVKDAESMVQTNIQEYKDQLRRETIDKAVEIAEQLIRKGLSTEDQRRILTEYVGKV